MSTLRATLTRTRLLGRDPVMTVSLAVSGLIAVLPVFGWSTDRVGLVSAALVTLGGVIAAWLVSIDRMLPLLVGLGKAVIAAVASFGMQLPDNQVSALMAVLTLVAGLATRPQVGAEQPARDRHGNELDARPGPLFISPTTEFFADDTAMRDAPPLPEPSGDAQRSDDTMAWSPPWWPVTEHLPRTDHEQAQQHRPGESTGRHHADWWPEGGGTLHPDLGT
jgi:hypothetical protein